MDVKSKNPEIWWSGNNYRIKPKPKQTIIIENWLCETALEDYIVIEASISHFTTSNYNQVKLFDTYEVEL